MKDVEDQAYEFGEFRVDAGKRLLLKGNREAIPLTPKVFDTLLYLVRNSGKLIEKDELMREIWADSIVEENNLNQNISILRRAFGEKPGEQRFIVTIAGRGYRFVPPVRPVPSESLGTAATEAEGVVPEGVPNEHRIAVAQNADKKSGRPFWSKGRKIAALSAAFLFVVAAVIVFQLDRNEELADGAIKTVAVLPFKPLVLESRNEALGLGMADALISKLSGGEIVVRPLSAVRRYGSPDQDGLAAGRELRVEAILDGTVQSLGDRIRISTRLFRTSDGKQLWAGQFDEKSVDIFAVQDSISERVAMALKTRLANQAKKHSTDNILAYQLYMTGRYHLLKLTPSNLQASIPYFQKAIDLQPDYALAYAGLAQANGVLGISGAVPASEALPKAKAAQLKALEIDETLAAAHTAACMSAFWYDWAWSAAEKHCQRAVELDPNNADAHQAYAQVLSSTGRHAEALREVKRSLELSPLDLGMKALEGQYLLYAGQPDKALVQLRETSKLEPSFWMPHMVAASVYIEKGMYTEAIAESRKEYDLSGGNVYPFGIVALAKSGNSAEALKSLQELEKVSSTRYLPPYNVALIYNALGMSDNALDWLAKAYEQRDPKMTFLKVEPKWNDLRRDARFVEIMKHMAFP
jgi:DNA-binding winged helix-turn-helix (wHTH) protein/TolB-like protein